jgi:hypothetical protein
LTKKTEVTEVNQHGNIEREREREMLLRFKGAGPHLAAKMSLKSK